jgi:hypothetical protein
MACTNAPSDAAVPSVEVEPAKVVVPASVVLRSSELVPSDSVVRSSVVEPANELELSCVAVDAGPSLPVSHSIRGGRLSDGLTVIPT